MEHAEHYLRLAAAYVRGSGKTCLPADLAEKPLDMLTEEELAAVYAAGAAAGLKLYRFKAAHDELPRVRKVLGFLRGISFDTLLDVGSGRGVFLLPFLNSFPWVTVTSADILDYRVAFLQDIARGGVDNLRAVEADLCARPFPADSFDVVTLLEVLEHIPDVAGAVRAAVAMAKKFVVVTVPSHPDNNPEHIHLLTKERLTALFRDAGCHRLRFDGVNGHLIMVAVIPKDKEEEEA